MQRLATFVLFGTMILAARSGAVSAQPIHNGPPTPMAMDRQDGISRIGLQLGFGFFDEPPNTDITALGAQAYGQYMTPSGFGVYGILPFNYLSIEVGNQDESESAIGGIELGGIYVVPGHQIDWVLHGGLVLPTASDDNDGPISGIATNGFGSFMRINDILLAYPELTALRLGVSPVLRQGQLVLRFDGAIDVPLAADGEEPDPLVRLNVGGGLDTGSFALLGELVNVISTEDNDNNDNDVINVLGITGRFMLGAFEPGVQIGFPLDDELNDLMDWYRAVSLQGAL